MRKYLVIVIFLAFPLIFFTQEAPDFIWAVKAGGTGSESGSAVAVDSLGNPFITGTYNSTIFFGELEIPPVYMGDIFIAKMDRWGNYLWAKGSGTTESEISTGIDVDFIGNSAIATQWGSFMALVRKYDTLGNFITCFGFGEYTSTAQATDLYKDNSGNIYFTGRFAGTVDIGGTELTSSGSSMDVFIVKIDSGNNVLWARGAGGDSLDYCNSIAVDRFGCSYIAGYFSGSANFGSTQLVSQGGYDAFIAKLDPNGNFLWATSAGGTGNNSSFGIAVDYFGRVYVTGCFESTAWFGGLQLASSGEQDIFVAMLNSSGNFHWAVKAGGSNSDVALDIASVNWGSAYISGYFTGTADFGSNQLVSEGESDIFISKIDKNGNFLWCLKAGGSGSDSAGGIALSCSGSPYITGGFESTAWFGDHPLTSGGQKDIFTARLSSDTDIIATYRFFNTIRGGHLYTISDIERDYIINDLPHYNYEGPKYSVHTGQAEGTVPVYRFFNNVKGGHLYTISEAERDSLMGMPQWNYEGIKFYVFTTQASDTVPVYRFFNNARGGHLYTISEAERDSLMGMPQWNYEGIKFYVYP